MDVPKKDEVPKDEGSQVTSGKSASVPTNPYSNLKREISEEDLKSPAVQRILLGEVDKLESKFLVLEDKFNAKVSAMETLSASFHEKDKEKAVLEEKVKTSQSQEILYSFCLAAGSAIIGFAKVVWDDGYGGMFLLLGVFLIIGGIISKAVKWK